MSFAQSAFKVVAVPAVVLGSITAAAPKAEADIDLITTSYFTLDSDAPTIVSGNPEFGNIGPGTTGTLFFGIDTINAVNTGTDPKTGQYAGAIEDVAVSFSTGHFFSMGGSGLLNDLANNQIVVADAFSGQIDGLIYDLQTINAQSVDDSSVTLNGVNQFLSEPSVFEGISIVMASNAFATEFGRVSNPTLTLTLNNVDLGATVTGFETEAVPEPSAFALVLGAGALAAAGARRRRADKPEAPANDIA